MALDTGVKESPTAKYVGKAFLFDIESPPDNSNSIDSLDDSASSPDLRSFKYSRVRESNDF